MKVTLAVDIRPLNSAASQLSPLAAELMNPAAVAMFTMAVWSLLANIGRAGAFPFSGVFAHWITWSAAGLAARSLAVMLQKRNGS